MSKAGELFGAGDFNDVRLSQLIMYREFPARKWLPFVGMPPRCGDFRDEYVYYSVLRSFQLSSANPTSLCVSGLSPLSIYIIYF